MKNQNQTKICRLIPNLSLFLFAAFWLAGCATPKSPSDPLAGWQPCDKSAVSKAIVEDYQEFIQQLPPNKKGYYIGDIGFFKTTDGDHAVSIEIFEDNDNAAWRYALVYNKNGRRVKIIKYGYRRYQS
jgi:hypothetical protein